MRTWVITIGEPLPVDEGSPRLYRSGILANMLADRGHDVVWWSSAFDHMLKKHRATSTESRQLRTNLRLTMLHGRGYRRNVSLARILDHRDLAREFRAAIGSEPEPDVIVSTMPTADLSNAALDYAVPRGIPVLLDCRDAWPEVFLEAVPRWLHPVARIAIQPAIRKNRQALSRATAISGMSDGYVEYGLGHAGRARTPLDRAFAFGYANVAQPQDAIDAANRFWDETLPPIGQRTLTACFFGTLGRQFDIETVVEAAGILHQEGCDVRFVLCGTGDNLERYRSLASGLPNVFFPGWVKAAQIYTLMRRSQVGLAPYFLNPFFEPAIPNKPPEYLSAGLPVVTSLWRGALRVVLEANDCGAFYKERDAAELARALRDLYEKPDRLVAMSARAKALFEESFRAEKVYGDMIAHLEGLARSAGRLGEAVGNTR